jgi:hypothetical protein
MYSGKIAVPPGGGGIVKTIIPTEKTKSRDDNKIKRIITSINKYGLASHCYVVINCTTIPCILLQV